MSHRLRHTTPIIPTAWAWVGGGMIATVGLVPGVLPPLMAQEPPAAATPTPSQTIADIQRRLQRLGHYQGPIDGLFGEPTRAAIARFQSQAGLARTGILDPLTQARLDAAIAPNSIPAAPLDPPSPDPVPPSPQFNFNLSGIEGEEDAPAIPSAGDGIAQGTTQGVNEGTGNGSAGTGSEVAPEGAEGADNSATPAAAARRSRWPLIAMGLIGLALALTLGGAALWLLLRRPPVAEDEPNGEQAAQPPKDPFGDEPILLANGHNYRGSFEDGPLPLTQRQQPQPPPQPPESVAVVQETLPVESTSLAQAPPPAESVPSSPASNPIETIAPGPETQRLAKVNILDALIEDLQSPDPNLRRKAIWELGQRGNSQAMQPLLGLMIAADSQERSLILATLSEISSRTLKPLNRALALSLQDENPEVRKNAIRDLTRIYDLMGQVSSLLTHAATDEDLEVRQTALWAMEQFSRLRLHAAGADPSDRLPGTPARDSLPPDRPH